MASPISRFLKDSDAPKVLGQAPCAAAIRPRPASTIRLSAPLKSLDTSISSSQDSETSSTSTSALSSTMSSPDSFSTTSSFGARDFLMAIPSEGRIRDLPCLLWWCQVSFAGHDIRLWYLHSLSHYEEFDACPPDQAMCIFCDETFADSRVYRCWQKRMIHIADHLEEGSKIEKGRPDFDVLIDMWEKKCMTKERFEHAIKGCERECIPKPSDCVLLPLGKLSPDLIAQQRTAEEGANRVAIQPSRQELQEQHRGKRPEMRPTKPRKRAVVVNN